MKNVSLTLSQITLGLIFGCFNLKRTNIDQAYTSENLLLIIRLATEGIASTYKGP